MANFTSEQANSCIIGRCESKSINEVHQIYVFSVVDDNGNLSGIIAQKDIISLTYSRW